jgi:amino acid transporter
MSTIDGASVPADAPAGPQKLRRVLSTADLLIFGMIFMVPIAPFALFAHILTESRGMIVLVYLIGMVCMIFTAMSYASMSRAFPSAGSVYTYAQRGLSETAGFFAGWLILLDYILIPALLYIISAAGLKPLLPAVPEWIWIVGFVAFNAVVNVIGVELGAKANRWLLALELVVLAVFVVAGVVALHHGVGAGRFTIAPLFDASKFSLSMALAATSTAVLAFLGFDGISTLGEDAKDADHGVARATILSLFLVGVLFMVQTWIGADLAVGHTFTDLDAGFYEIAELVGGTWLKNLTLATVVIASGIANAMAAQSAVSRILYAMARDRKLPTALASLHPRYRTPYVATVAVAVISLAVGLAFADRLEDLSRLVNFGALTGFLLLHLAVINHFVRRTGSRRWFVHLVSPLAGFVTIAFVIFEMDSTAKTLGALWIALGVGYYLILRKLLNRPVTLDV